MIGFGVLFPFFRSGLLYSTPSLGGFTLAAGIYDPVILAGKWERVVTPTAELEAAFTRPIGRRGLFKLFASGIWQQLGAAGNPPMPGGMPDNRAVANKKVTQYGGAAGARLELGPVRVGATGHYGRGLGFFYAQENSEAAAYSAMDTADPRDGDLRAFRGFYGQLMLVLGKIDVAVGAGVSQLVPLPFDNTSTTHLPKQNLGVSAGVFFHIRDYLVYSIDYFDGQSTWWGTSFTQRVHAINTGITMTF